MRPLAIIALMGLLAGALPAASGQELIYRYTDDFSQDSAVDDSTLHSVFWVKGAMPASQPHLVYWTIQAEDRVILFRDYRGQPARLGYPIPVRPEELIRTEPATVEVSLDVQLLSGNDPAKPTMGYLLYMVSADGNTWSIPKALTGGHCQLHLGNLKDNRSLVFVGTCAAIDNLAIEIYRPKASLYVPQDAPTIQQAVDIAKDGDRIIVRDGEYSGPGNRDIRFKGKAVSLASANGPSQCVINCQLQGRGFIFDGGESRSAIVDGFTIVNGQAPSGSAIYCQDASPTIANCLIRYCLALGTSNAGQGGGIYCKGGSPLIQYCEVLQNEAKSSNAKSGLTGYGGGIFLTGDCGAVIEHCVLGANAADSESGGKGGGLYVETAAASVAKVPTIRNCLFYGNMAGNSGGAIACVDARPSIHLCTIANNTSGLAGAALSVVLTRQGSGTLSLENSIIWGNTPTEIAEDGAQGVLVARYCDVRGGWPGPGNIEGDPCFASPSSKDYHLLSLAGRWDPIIAGGWVHDSLTSPCVDAGDPGAGAGAEPTPNGNRVNLGCYGGTVEASKGAGPLVFHVAQTGGNNQNDGLSASSPLATIQQAVDLAQDGDSILVWPGTYREGVDFTGKAITLQSAADAATVVAAHGGCAFSFNHQEGSSSVLRNLVIRGCSEAGVLCHTGSPTLSNLTIVNCGVGVKALESTLVSVSNCILWDNAQADLSGCQARYSCIQHADQAAGTGNIRRTPLFVDPAAGDFHLSSRYGHCWSKAGVWIVDDQTSPCIDAGDPNDYPVEEPAENGGRINLGAYGGTGYASKSPPALESDLNRDGIVDFRDMAILANHWLESGV